MCIRDRFTSTEFTAARQHLDELIHPPAAVTVDPEATRVRRMTVVGDDVE